MAAAAKKKSDAGGDGTKTIVVNRKARHEYHIEESFEAGIMLTGSEVKSLRAGKAHIQESHGHVRNGELWLIGSHITEYTPAAQFGHEPTRARKLLLHRREIDRLAGKVKELGLTLVPLRLFFKHGLAKLEIGLARGKKLHDKRESIKERESHREVDRHMKTGRRNYDA